MIRLRQRITLARLAAVPLIVGLTFAVGSWGHAPWPASALNAALFVLPVFIAGPTLAQWLVFYLVAGILVGLIAPPVVTHGGPRAVTRAPASPAVVPPVRGNPPAQ